MRFTELLMLALLGWTGIGVLGVGLSLVRKERAQAARGMRWICTVWVIYVAVLLGVSLMQRQRMVPLGKEQCFGDMCFSVAEVNEIPIYAGRNRTGDGSRLVQVSIRVENKSKGNRKEGLLRAYLLDGQGRRWDPMPGLTGVRLTAVVSSGGVVRSEPVFKVPADASNLKLVLTKGHWQPGVLVIGDSDSWWHKRTVVALGL